MSFEELYVLIKNVKLMMTLKFYFTYNISFKSLILFCSKHIKKILFNNIYITVVIVVYCSFK